MSRRCLSKFDARSDFRTISRSRIAGWCKRLLISNKKFGAQLIDHAAVQSVQVVTGKVQGVNTSQGLIGASSVVIAAGAWSSMIDPAKQIQVEPVRGQMLCFQAQPQIARYVIYSSQGYLIPRADGRLLAGSTTEEAGFDKSVTD